MKWQWRNSPLRYGWLSAGLHWFMLILLIAVYASMELREFYPKGSAPREAMKTWHYMLGLTVLGLTIVRLAVAVVGPVPAISPRPTKWISGAASLMKVALYLLMICMPLLGWLLLSAKGNAIPFFGLHLAPLINENKALAESIKELHETVAVAGYFLIGAHAAAALYHHFLVRDDTLRRILPPTD